MKAYDVFLVNEYDEEEHIDTVFVDDDLAAEDVRRSLVNHDGYDPAIVVKEAV